jgi:capsular exopolysaccharide synthesis family protein
MRRLVSETNEVTALDRMFSIPMVDSDSNLATLRNSLVNARKEVVLLSETYGPAHPKYRSALAGEQALQIQFRDMLGQSIMADDKRREVLEGEEIELQRLYDEERKTAIEGARDTFTMIHLQNAVERHRKLFDALVQRMLEVDISSGFSKTAVEVVEPACIPTSPINPRKGERLAVFLFMGLFLGVAAAFFLENLDDTIKTPEDLKQLVGIPLLGFIPSVAMPREPKVEKDFVYRGRMALFEPMSSVSEAYRNTRTNLFYCAPADELKVLGITSSTPQEGKTTTSANMAIVIAQSGRKVLLVDADLHRPMVHKVFGMGAECGLTTVLVGEADANTAIRQAFHQGEAVPNLYILPAGPSSPNPAELLGSMRMKKMLESQRKEYDWILVDTPPVLFVSDASIVAALCDAVLFVVKAGAGNRTVLRRTREQLTNVHCRILGGVLNNMKVSRVGRHYSDYYYHGYARYAKDYHRAYYGKKDQDS